jgi:hypothetical protein
MSVFEDFEEMPLDKRISAMVYAMDYRARQHR